MNGNRLKFIRKDFTFYSEGLKCSAWLYLPDGIDLPPVVIMANGMGAERSILLPDFAERFAQNGLACFVFDYRNFGDSEGEPRKLIDPDRQLVDWSSAIEFVRTLAGINTNKIALWGTSFSGGMSS